MRDGLAKPSPVSLSLRADREWLPPKIREIVIASNINLDIKNNFEFISYIYFYLAYI